MSAWIGRAIVVGTVLLGAGCGGGPQEESWSPFEADLLFSSDHEGNSEIYLKRGGDPEWLNLSRHPAQDNWPEWSPDGTRVVFQGLRSGNLDIWVMQADGSDPVQLTDDPAHDYLPSWSADGEEILFASWRSEEGEETSTVHVYSMRPDGSDQRRILEESPGTSTPVVRAPGGTNLLLSRKLDDRGADVCLVAPTGELIRRYTEDPGHDGAPSYSPDGERIVYYSDGGESSRLMVVDADGSSPRVILEGGQNWYPRWSPDGRWIVYTATVPGDDSGNLDLFAIRSDGSGDPLLLAGGPRRESEGRWRPVPAGGE